MNLENNGERVDINFYNMDYDKFDIYQKSHYKRYEKALEIISENDVVADMACGTGYGTLTLSKKCKEVHGVDIDEFTISEIKKRYANEENIYFHKYDLLDIEFENKFDFIVSFETVEHFSTENISVLMKKFHKALKPEGSIIFSTPYNQLDCDAARRHHKTFFIKEDTVDNMIKGLFKLEDTWYQDYETHDLSTYKENKIFIICKAKKL